ncbi:uncharacterized protein LOC144626353 [Crassostrea virginica]
MFSVDEIRCNSLNYLGNCNEYSSLHMLNIFVQTSWWKSRMSSYAINVLILLLLIIKNGFELGQFMEQTHPRAQTICFLGLLHHRNPILHLENYSRKAQIEKAPLRNFYRRYRSGMRLRQS